MDRTIGGRNRAVRLDRMETLPRVDLAGLLDRQVRRYHDKPFLTWYDDARGERVELSYKTFANWLAKTANLLVEELGVEPGERVALLLPTHWQTVVVRAACWLAGVRAQTSQVEAAAVFAREERLGEVTTAAAVPVVALTADWLGRPAGDLGEALNFARAASAMGDHFAASAAAAAEAGAGAAGASVEAELGELLALAAGVAGHLGMTDRDRLHSSLPVEEPFGAVASVLAPLRAGAGVVLEAAAEPGTGRFWRRLADERVTVACLSAGSVAALLEAPPPVAKADGWRPRVAWCPDTAESADGFEQRFQQRFGVPLLTRVS